MHETLVDCGTLRLSIRDHDGEEPAILALHGLASNARWWDLVAARLSPPRRVIAADLRGHGRSDKPETGYSFPEVVEDLRGLCAALNVKEVIVAGHSWGASVALWFVAELRDLALGCICVDSGATDLRAYFGDSWAEARERMLPPQFSGLSAAAVRGWMVNSALVAEADPETVTQIMLGNFEEAEDGSLRPRLRVERHMEIARQLYELQPYRLMRRVRCPVLLIPAGDIGAPPDVKRRAMDRAEKVLGNRAQVVWVEGVHDIPVQHPAAVAAAIAEFATGLTPTADVPIP